MCVKLAFVGIFFSFIFIFLSLSLYSFSLGFIFSFLTLFPSLSLSLSFTFVMRLPFSVYPSITLFGYNMSLKSYFMCNGTASLSQKFLTVLDVDYNFLVGRHHFQITFSIDGISISEQFGFFLSILFSSSDEFFVAHKVQADDCRRVSFVTDLVVNSSCK